MGIMKECPHHTDLKLTRKTVIIINYYDSRGGAFALNAPPLATPLSHWDTVESIKPRALDPMLIEGTSSYLLATMIYIYMYTFRPVVG